MYVSLSRVRQFLSDQAIENVLFSVTQDWSILSCLPFNLFNVYVEQRLISILNNSHYRFKCKD